MPHDQPTTGASPESVRQGYEPLRTNTRALLITMTIFVVLCAGMFWMLAALLHHYMAQNAPEDAPPSAAPLLLAIPTPPLQPMPRHNDLDWQDMVHLRQEEDAHFRQLGWKTNRLTGEAEMPAAVIDSIRQQYGGDAPLAAANAGLRFPPTMAPVRIGGEEPLAHANVFPPVGSAAAAEELNESIFRPVPGPHDVKDLPTQSGPARAQNVPTAAPRQ